jgi:hypothetical protein
VEVTETTAFESCSATSANDGRATAGMGLAPAAGTAAGAAAGVARWAEAHFVRSRVPARIIPKTTEAETRAATEITLLLVRIRPFS